jgi:hypothetical protein
MISMQRARLVLLGLAGLVVLIFAIPWAFDYTQADSVHLHVTLSPPRIPADGRASTVFTVTAVGPHGAPRVGDTIELVLEAYGSLDRNRSLTDSMGKASFVYTSYLSSQWQPAGPVKILVTDTSLGHMVEIDKVFTAVIPTFAPTQVKGGA